MFLLQGDHLIAECTYSSKSRQAITLGGLSTREETCLVSTLYYPRIELSLCYSLPSLPTVLQSLGIQKLMQWVFVVTFSVRVWISTIISMRSLLFVHFAKLSAMKQTKQLGWLEFREIITPVGLSVVSFFFFFFFFISKVQRPFEINLRGRFDTTLMITTYASTHKAMTRRSLLLLWLL